MSRYAYHFVTEDMRSGHGRKRWRDGVTERYTGRLPIAPCKRGLHSSPTPWDALQYAPGPLLSLVEIPDEGPECIAHGTPVGIAHGTPVDKHVSTWRRRILTIDLSRDLRLFACDVAEEALDTEGVTDERSRNAIAVARRFADGIATREELAAARDAADAAWDAADAEWNAAWDAAAAASAAAWEAAWDAARAAAWDAHRRRFNALIEPLFAAAHEASS